MFANKRLSDLFATIRNAEYTPTNKLASLYKVTDRTVRNDITKLNEILQDKGAHIEMRRGMGYRLVIDDPESYQAFLATQEKPHTSGPDLTSTDDRIRFLLSILLTSDTHISALKLAELVYVGENTMQNYLHQIRGILEEYDLALVSRHGQGLKIFGREADRRRCFMEKVIVRDSRSYVTGFSASEQALFPTIDLLKLEEIVHRNLMNSEVATSDYGIKNLLMHIALMIDRIQHGCAIEGDRYSGIAPRFNELLDATCSEIEQAFGISISETERDYLYRHVLLNIKLSAPGTPEDRFSDEVDEMLESIYTNYGFDLRHDDELKQNLLTHLNSLFASHDLPASRKNPLLGTIRSNFPLAFEIALTSTLKVFDQEPYAMTEDEVGYIALHLGAALERRAPAATRRQKVIVVCGNGHAIALMLKSRIETMFSDRLEVCKTSTYREFAQLSAAELAEISFAVSTVPLDGCSLPWTLVDFSLRPHDTEAIARLANGAVGNDDLGLDDLFSEKLFTHIEGIAPSREEVIETLCGLLEDEGIVDESFHASVLKREGISDTSMTRNFAIPHPLKPSSSSTKVAVALLDEGIRWSADATDVRIVFLLAVRAGEMSEIERLYDLLIEVTNNRNLRHTIMAAKSFDELMQAISRA